MQSLTKRKDNIEGDYKFDTKLGEGAFSQVIKAIKTSTGEEFAVKIIKKGNLNQEDLLGLQTEVEILSQIDHPNIVKLFDVYEDKNNFYLVLELMTGGELFDRVVEKEHFSEKEAAITIRPIVDALRYCHSMGIAHRDLKPENLLYATRKKDAVIKISDFGLARFFIKDEKMMTQCGTPGYAAPEVIIGKGYDCSVDFWSVGVILYVLLCGFPPFFDEDPSKLFELIKRGAFDFPSPYWDDVSDSAKELIKKMLTVDPKKRIKAEEILNHPWVIGDSTPRKPLPGVLSGIKSINTRNKA